MSTVQDHAGVELLEQLGKAGDGKPPLGCMQCGMCAASCPLGQTMEFPPRKLILQAMAGNLDKVLASPSLWMCVGCYTCSLRCPRDIELTDGLWPALRDRAMQQGFQPPAGLQETFQNVFKYGNTLGKSPRQRLDWAKNLEVRVLDLSKEPRPVDVLWLVGCYPSYYPRNQVVTRAFARILTALGISWGVLGAKERAIGECDRMFGEEGLFETLVEQNRKLLDQCEFEKIVTLDPHAFRALQNFYPRFGAWYPVQHYIMLLAAQLGLPYVGVIRGVKAGAEPGTVAACKEFPGAVMARMKVKLPAVLGILGADQPPRYVPVSRIRAAMKTTQFEEQEAAAPAAASLVAVRRLYPPAAATHAEMLSGSEAEVAARIAELLAEKGLVK